MTNQRIKYWDNIKGFTILLVLWGHLIQAIYGYDYAASSANLVYGVIYSFHMALFFMVSGYFSCYDGREMNVLSVLKKKSAGLLIPFFVVGGLYVNYCYSTNPYSILFANAKYGYWYLFVLFELVIINIFYHVLRKIWRCSKFDFLLDMLFWLVFFASAEVLNIISSQVVSGFFSLKHLAGNLPFFALGLFLNRQRVFNFLTDKRMVAALFCLYLFLLVHVYPESIAEKRIFKDVARISAVVAMLGIFYNFRNIRILDRLFNCFGKSSLDIYVFHYYFLILWLWYGMNATLPITVKWSELEKDICTLIGAVVVAFICMIIGKLLRSNRLTAFVFLGQMQKKTKSEESVTFHFRNRKCGFSIAHVFEPVVNRLSDGWKVDTTEMPSPNSMPWDVLINGFYVLRHKNKHGVNHITGHIHDALLFLGGCKTVLTIHDLVFVDNVRNPIKKMYKWLFWLYLPVRIADKVTCISEQTRRNLLKHCPWAEKKTVVIYNSVDEKFCFSEKNFNAECPVILHIGTFWNKNLERVIEALDGIDCELRIIGEISDEIKVLLKKHNIKFVQRANLTEEEIVEEYKLCDIVSFPSIYEGFGMPIIEGQSVGRPVLTSRIEPMTEVAGNAAYFVNPESVQEISEGFRKLISDESLRQKLVSDGLENIKRFKLSCIVRQYEDVYKEVLAK